MRLWLRATGVLLFGVLAIGSTSAYGQITNPSFEDGTGTDLSGVTGWTTGVGGAGAGGFSGARSTSWQTDGSYAVYMENEHNGSFSAGQYEYLRQDVTLYGRYAIMFDVNIEDTTGDGLHVEARVLVDGDAKWTSATTGVALNQTINVCWCGPRTLELQIYVPSSGTFGTDRVWFDNFRDGYFVYGSVTRGTSGVPDVVMTATPSGTSTTTDIFGDYVLALEAGTHTITPSKAGYVFSPTSRVVTLGPTQYDVDFTAELAPPDPPVMDPEPEYTQGTSNTVSWGAVDGADEYYAQRSTDDSFTTTVNSGWTTNTLDTSHGLTDGQIYYYRVKARNADNESGWSNVVHSTQDASPPTSSIDPMPSPQTTRKITVSWTMSDATSGVKHVHVYQSYEGGAATEWGPFTGTSIMFTMGSDGTYSFYSRATDNVGNTEDAPGTPDMTVTLDGTAPTSEAGPLDPYYTTASMDIPYTANDGTGTGVDHINLSYRRRPLSGGAWGGWTQYVGDYTASPITFDTSTTGGNGQYEFYTLGTDNVGHVEEAPGTADCSTRILADFHAPTMDPEPEYTPGTSNELSWTDTHPDATHSQAQCSTDGAFGTVFSDSGLLPGPTSSHEFSGLTEGVKYHYRARAICQLTSESTGAWTQTTQAEFETDTLSDTIATSDGDVVLASTGDLVTETVGGKKYGYSSTIYNGHFNLFSCSSSRILTEIEIYAGIWDDIDVQFAVYESATDSGPFARVHANTRPVSGTGHAFYSSGPVSVPLEAGSYYLIGVGRSDGESYVWGQATHPDPVAFGQTVRGYKYAGDYPLPGTVSAELTSTATCYYFRLTSASYLDYMASGTITSTAIAPGPFQKWGTLNYNATMPADTTLTLDVLDGTSGTDLLTDVAAGADLDVAGVTASSIKLRANLATTDDSVTPALHDWTVGYYHDIDRFAQSAWSDVVHSTQVDPNCELAYTGDTNKAFGEEVNLSAHLTASGFGIEGQTVNFTVDRFTGDATTDSNGDAAVTVGAHVLKPGTYTVHCRSDGGGGYNPATATGTLQITGGGTDTVVAGHGWYFKEGRKRCMAKFRYSDGAQAGFLTIKDLATRTNIVAVSVTNVTVYPGGDDATITGDCNINGSPTPVAFQLDVTASSNSFHFEAGSYEAGPTTLKGKIEISEE